MAAGRPALPGRLFAAFAVPFVGTALAVLVATSCFEARVRAHVREFLAAEGPPATVLVNGRRPAEEEALLDVLSRLDSFPAHHSHPGERFPVLLRRGEEEIFLELGRDSEIASEYWVYCPAWSFTDWNEIGRIRTEALARVPSPDTGKIGSR